MVRIHERPEPIAEKVRANQDMTAMINNVFPGTGGPGAPRRATERAAHLTRDAIWLVLLCINLAPVAAHAGEAHPATELFTEANQAYDEGRFPDAVSLYEQILENGYESGSLLFNLGNAYYRKGRPGQAILWYKRASYLQPRDPDIAYNLRFVMQTAGVSPPDSNLHQRIARRLTETEWIGIGVAGYWLAFLGLGFSLILSGKRIFLLRMAIPSVLVMFVGLLGIGYWASLRLRPEVIMIQNYQEVLFAPLEGATVHFMAPEGTVGRQLDQRNGWVLVSVGDNRGWIRETAIQKVQPNWAD